MNEHVSAIHGLLVLHDDLAVYSTGDGEPLLLMPYPHGFGVAPIAQGPLATALRDLNRRVVAFDPPGAFNTPRQPDMSMHEMLACANETLAAFEVQRPVTLVGHSMGGLCAIAYALTYPERVGRLILIGTLSGGSAIQRARGMPWGSWLTGLDRWRYTFWGMWLGWGLGGSLALHKKMYRLIVKASYADKCLVPAVEIDAGDDRRPAPVRDRWPRTVFMQRLDYRSRLSEIYARTQVCVGRYDPQAPVACSEELAAGIPGARLTIFEHSGHYPFVEERERFKSVLCEFLSEQ